MIQAKLKICAGCNQPKHIWKSDGKDKYCKECWYQHQPPKGMPKPTKRPNPISVKMKQTIDSPEQEDFIQEIHPFLLFFLFKQLYLFSFV
jgi:hypothetical protein